MLETLTQIGFLVRISHCVNPVNIRTWRIQGFQDSTTEFGHSFVHFMPPPCASLVSPLSLGLLFMSHTSTSQLTCSENSDSIHQDISRSDGGGQVSSIKYLIRFLYPTHYTSCSNRTRRVWFIHRSLVLPWLGLARRGSAYHGSVQKWLRRLISHLKIAGLVQLWLGLGLAAACY